MQKRAEDRQLPAWLYNACWFFPVRLVEHPTFADWLVQSIVRPRRTVLCENKLCSIAIIMQHAVALLRLYAERFECQASEAGEPYTSTEQHFVAKTAI